MGIRRTTLAREQLGQGKCLLKRLQSAHRVFANGCGVEIEAIHEHHSIARQAEGYTCCLSGWWRAILLWVRDLHSHGHNVQRHTCLSCGFLKGLSCEYARRPDFIHNLKQGLPNVWPLTRFPGPGCDGVFHVGDQNPIVASSSPGLGPSCTPG